MIVTDNIVNTWEVTSLLDFIHQFHLQEQILKDFNDIKDMYDIYESEKYICDQDHITEYLEQDKRIFKLEYIDIGRCFDGEYWRITEIEVPVLPTDPTENSIYLIKKLLTEIRKLTPKDKIVKIHDLKMQEKILDKVLLDKDKLINNLKHTKASLELVDEISNLNE